MSQIVDPQYVLDLNANILDTYGGIASLKFCKKFVKLLKNSGSLVQRCIYLNILNATPSEEIRQDESMQTMVYDQHIVSVERFHLRILRMFDDRLKKNKIIPFHSIAGAWNVLHDWLKQSEIENTWSFVKELLKTFIQFPLTIDLLKLNNIPKIIRRLSKRLDVDSEVRDLAADIVLIWKDIIVDEKANNQYQQPFTSNDIKIKNKHFGLKMLHDRNSLNIFSSIDPNIDLEEDIDEYSPPIEPPANSLNGNGTVNEDYDVAVVEDDKTSDAANKLSKPTKASLKSFSPPRNIEKKRKKFDTAKQHVNLFDKLKPVKGSPTVKNMSVQETAVVRNAPPTAKTFSSKFRPSGFETELETPQPLKKFRIPKKGESAAKTLSNGAPAPVIVQPKIRPTPSEVIKATVQKRTLSSTVANNSIGYSKPSVSNTVVSQQTPLENTLINRPPSIKTVPAPTAPLVKEELIEPPKQKRLKMSPPPQPALEPIAIAAQTVPAPSNVTVPVTSNVASPPPVSPVSAPMVKPKPPPPKQIQLIESDIFMAALEGNSAQKAPLIRRKRILPKTANGTGQTSQATSSSMSSDSSKVASVKRPSIDKQITDDLNLSASNAETDNGRKRVRWAKENELVKVQLFEVDESERVNVNRLKLQGDYKHCEMLRERAYMEQKRRQNMGDEKEWKLVPVDGLNSVVEYGSKSNEKNIQAERQKNVLAEVFLPGMPPPDSAKEPELTDRSASQEPIIIPLEEVAPSTSTQLPPELNKLLEGLKQNGMMPQPNTAAPSGLPNFLSNLLPGAPNVPIVRPAVAPMIPSNLSPQEQQQMLMQQMMAVRPQPSWSQQMSFPPNRFHGANVPPPNTRFMGPVQRPPLGRPSL